MPQWPPVSTPMHVFAIASGRGPVLFSCRGCDGHSLGFGEDAHGSQLAEIGRGDLVFIGVVTIADDRHVSVRAEALGCCAVNDLRAHVRVSLDLVNDCRLATDDQERLPDAMLLT